MRENGVGLPTIKNDAVIGGDAYECILVGKPTQQTPSGCGLSKAERPYFINVLELLKVYAFGRLAADAYELTGHEATHNRVRRRHWEPKGTVLPVQYVIGHFRNQNTAYLVCQRLERLPFDQPPGTNGLVNK
jgi:hypothetical protein